MPCSSGPVRPARESIRVWCAGCATGEEAYTLALLAAQAFAPAPAPVDVLGTDISRAALAAAADGRYRERAVRVLEPALRSATWTGSPTAATSSAICCAAWSASARTTWPATRSRRRVKPASTSSPAGTCSSTSARRSSAVIGSLKRALRPGGMLMLGAADALHRLDCGRAAAPSGAAGRPGRRDHPGPGCAARSRREPSLSREQRLAAALDAADQGDRDGALAHVASLLADSPLDADAHFIHGLVMLGAG